MRGTHRGDGLAGSAAIAFGVVSGVAHGIGESERFDASAWHKAPQERTEGAMFGRPSCIGITGLNRSFTRKELELLIKSKGGRRLISCNDRSCCPRGYSDMKADPRRHAVHQIFRSITWLEAIPDLKREHYFLNGPMTVADRIGREIRSLKVPASGAAEYGISATEFTKRLQDHSRKLAQTLIALERLHEIRGSDAPRVRSVAPRVGVERTPGEDRP